MSNGTSAFCPHDIQSHSQLIGNSLASKQIPCANCALVQRNITFVGLLHAGHQFIAVHRLERRYQALAFIVEQFERRELERLSSGQFAIAVCAVLCQRPGVNHMEANFFLKHCRQLRKFFEGEIVIVVFIDQEVDLWHPVDVGVFDAIDTHAFYKELERNILNVDCSPVEVDIAPSGIIAVNNFVQIHAQQARKGATQDGECVSGFGKLRQARCEGMLFW